MASRDLVEQAPINRTIEMKVTFGHLVDGVNESSHFDELDVLPPLGGGLERLVHSGLIVVFGRDAAQAVNLVWQDHDQKRMFRKGAEDRPITICKARHIERRQKITSRAQTAKHVFMDGPISFGSMRIVWLQRVLEPDGNFKSGDRVAKNR